MQDGPAGTFSWTCEATRGSQDDQNTDSSPQTETKEIPKPANFNVIFSYGEIQKIL